jgi:hypothetical protein
LLWFPGEWLHALKVHCVKEAKIRSPFILDAILYSKMTSLPVRREGWKPVFVSEIKNNRTPPQFSPFYQLIFKAKTTLSEVSSTHPSSVVA